jgi:hypothetical protein
LRAGRLLISEPYEKASAFLQLNLRAESFSAQESKRTAVRGIVLRFFLCHIGVGDCVERLLTQLRAPPI